MIPTARVVFFVLIGLLAACHHNTVTNSNFATCAIMCKQRLDVCNQVCHNNCRKCSSAAQCAATISYNKYKHVECVEGGFIARQLNSFRDPLQCRKTTCECRADYTVCIQSCSGVIQKRLQVAPTCN